MFHKTEISVIANRVACISLPKIGKVIGIKGIGKDISAILMQLSVALSITDIYTKHTSNKVTTEL